MLKLIIGLAFALLTTQSSAVSFESAKNNLYLKVYDRGGKTVYAGCDWYISKGNKKVVDLASCGLEDAFPRGQLNRAERVEAEHIVAASWLLVKDGQTRKCALEAKYLKESAREHCQKTDPDYRMAHNDLVNLVPSVGQINANRGNKPFSDTLSGDNKVTYRGNGRTTTITSRVILPPEEMRGDIARIHFFMSEKYGWEMNQRTTALMTKWSKMDPVSQEELERNNRIKKAQGWANPNIFQ